MKLRKWKIAALLATGAVLLQAAGCATLIVQLIAQQLLTTALSAAVDAAVGGSTTNVNTTP